MDAKFPLKWTEWPTRWEQKETEIMKNALISRKSLTWFPWFASKSNDEETNKYCFSRSLSSPLFFFVGAMSASAFISHKRCENPNKMRKDNGNRQTICFLSRFAFSISIRSFRLLFGVFVGCRAIRHRFSLKCMLSKSEIFTLVRAFGIHWNSRGIVVSFDAYERNQLLYQAFYNLYSSSFAFILSSLRRPFSISLFSESIQICHMFVNFCDLKWFSGACIRAFQFVCSDFTFCA